MDYQSIIDRFYPEDNELRRILMVHSRQVADRCLLIAKKHPELKLDVEFLEEAAMLHDIGIYRCNAPGIQCFGTEPYIRHGIIGGEILREEGWGRHALVCERHTGTGLTKWDIEQQQLPLPHQDFMPEVLEEQVVCYADKFYSKTNLGSERSVVDAMRSLEKFGWDGVHRFQKWVDMFE
ncbi:MAG: HD domain-containing protein [Prevotella sp.]|nr:HD domain-containing protein [Prevotella sp.]